MSRPFQADHAAGPVAAASARASAYSRASVWTSPTASATDRIVTGSARSRRVAVSGSSRCCRTTRSTTATSAADRPIRVATVAAIGAPLALWSPGSPLPMSCSSAASTSRSGRGTSRAYDAASRAVSTRCRSTVYLCTGLRWGRLRTRAHSGSQAVTSPYRSHASQVETRADPEPSRVSNASRAGAGHGAGSGVS